MKQIQEEDLAKLAHREQVVFALFCAKQVHHLVEEKHKKAVDKCINITERWIVGEATGEECREVADATYDAAYAAAIYTAAAAAYVAYADAYAASAATYAAAYATVYTTDFANAIENKDKTIKEQWECYNALLNLENYLL
jgi:hypothetical protein